MKGKFLISSIITIISFANIAHADIYMHSDDANACANIAGTWQGHGTLAFLLEHCAYTGSGNISTINPDGTFTLNVNANKDSGGSVFCPGNLSSQLSGACKNGSVIFRTDYGTLQGTFSGNKGSATGQLSVFGTKADVNIQFQR